MKLLNVTAFFMPLISSRAFHARDRLSTVCVFDFINTCLGKLSRIEKRKDKALGTHLKS